MKGVAVLEQRMTGGMETVAYETKVLLIALAKIVRKADNIKEIYDAIEEMANAEGVVLKPLDEDDKIDKA